jgi:hypothetical protein
MLSPSRFLLLAALAAFFGSIDSVEAAAGPVAISKASKLALTRKDGTVIFDNLAQSVAFTKNKYESTRANFQRSHGYPIPGTPKLDMSRVHKRTTEVALSPQSGGACEYTMYLDLDFSMHLADLPSLPLIQSGRVISH